MIQSRAPLRISFAGGGTDVPPYPERYGGAVLSATINKYAYASLEIFDYCDVESVKESLDYDIVAKYHTIGNLRFDGNLDLLKAVLRRMRPGRSVPTTRLLTHSDAPPGSGLGSSSALVVALVGLFNDTDEYEIAYLAYEIERNDLGLKGGYQDQFASSFGGFNFMEFGEDGVNIFPLHVKAKRQNELEYRLLLCYTGNVRTSAKIMDQQIEDCTLHEVNVMNDLDRQKELAYSMKQVLLEGKLDDLGGLLDQAWQSKKKRHPAITNPHIDEMYYEAMRAGAMGGKLLGTGGGGYLLFYCQHDKKHLVAERMEKMGGQAVSFGFDLRGLQTWER